MKKVVFIILSIILVVLCSPNVYATNTTLSKAKKYEGNLYKYHTSGDWLIFSDGGTSLGEPIELSDNSVVVEYYTNKEDNYILQYIHDSSNTTYAKWQDGTIVEMYRSKY